MPQPQDVHRFGPFEVNVRTGELRKHGARLRLQEQPFQILAALLERPGDLVTREELRQRIWPGDTFVDFDHGLNTAINKLRESLSDSAASPHYIETLPRRGYRLVATVEQETISSAQTRTEVATQPADATTSTISNNDFNPGSSGQAAAQDSQPANFENISSRPASIPSESDESTSQRFNPVDGGRQAPAIDETTAVSRTLVRVLFNLIQVMYLVFYIEAVGHLRNLHDLAEGYSSRWAAPGMVLILVAGIVGIAIRLFLFSAVAFDIRHFGQMFRRLFPALLPLDFLWALAPFLIAHLIGAGFALAACAPLLWLPFAQRTLVRMAYGESPNTRPVSELL